MKAAGIRFTKPRVLSLLGLLAVTGVLLALLDFPHQAAVKTAAADDFNRANGHLGSS